MTAVGLHGGYGMRLVHEGAPAMQDYRLAGLAGPDQLTGIPADTLLRNVASWMRLVQQGGTSMCVTCVDSLRIGYQRRDAGVLPDIDPNPIWTYGECHIGDLVEGTDPLRALQVATDVGVLPWRAPEVIPTNETAADAVRTLSSADAAEARKYRIGAHATVPVDLAHIRAVLHQGLPVALAGAVFDAFEVPQPMPVSPHAPDNFRLAIGHVSSCAGILPASWLRQAARGGHQWLTIGTLSRQWLPAPLSEGVNDYLVCVTSWGQWLATGPIAIFLLPATYLANVYLATVITKVAA